MSYGTDFRIFSNCFQPTFVSCLEYYSCFKFLYNSPDKTTLRFTSLLAAHLFAAYLFPPLLLAPHLMACSFRWWFSMLSPDLSWRYPKYHHGKWRILRTFKWSSSPIYHSGNIFVIGIGFHSSLPPPNCLFWACCLTQGCSPFAKHNTHLLLLAKCNVIICYYLYLMSSLLRNVHFCPIDQVAFCKQKCHIYSCF